MSQRLSAEPTPHEDQAAVNTNTPVLPLACYRLHFATVDPMRLSDYSGSAWRGVFGHALKRLMCVTREQHCSTCLLYRSCIYPYLFETPPDPSAAKLRKYTAAPHPYVLDPPPARRESLPAGTALELGVTLFGHSNRHLPYVIHALDQAGRRGLKGARLILQQVQQLQMETSEWQLIHVPGKAIEASCPATPSVPACPARLTLMLDTPLRLRAHEHYVTPERFHFRVLFTNLLRRISLLTTFHSDTPLETDFAALTRAAQTIETERTALHWHDWSRYSSRQNTLLRMGGLLGQVSLKGADLEPFWPYLWLGQWTHAGKGTSMGLGKYRIVMR
jgi:hypothetical protein